MQLAGEEQAHRAGAGYQDVVGRRHVGRASRHVGCVELTRRSSPWASLVEAPAKKSTRPRGALSSRHSASIRCASTAAAAPRGNIAGS